MDPIERVRDGMRVVDATGGSVGKVAEVRLGDREAVTTKGQSSDPDSGLLSFLTRGLDYGEQQPRPRAELLERIGYVRVDTGGLFGDDTYFSADEILSVGRDTVHITQRTG